jgi:hypothetical protein
LVSGHRDGYDRGTLDQNPASRRCRCRWPRLVLLRLKLCPTRTTAARMPPSDEPRNPRTHFHPPALMPISQRKGLTLAAVMAPAFRHWLLFVGPFGWTVTELLRRPGG